VRTEVFANGRVESLYEAFRRVRGPRAFSAAIYAPFGRGADHAALEGRNTAERGRLRALTDEVAGDCDPRWAREGHKQVIDESTLDNRGMAQVIELFTASDRPPPDFVYHELALTDGAGHDYGPHSDGLRAALAESDRRVARVLELLEQRGLFDETLFVLTADHGMAPQDRALRLGLAREVERAGIEAVVAEPMIWLRDLRVEVERAADGRTGRVLVAELDALPTGEQPAVEGAEVVIELHAEGEAPRAIARGQTGPGGVFGFPTPPEVESPRIGVAVRAPGRNPRHLLLDGTTLALDLRKALYGANGGA
jgi:hypothetical protein